MKNRQERIREAKRLSKEFPAALSLLCKYIEQVEQLEGSSVMNGVGLIEVMGDNYEIQLRLEKDPKLFIGETGFLESIGANIPKSIRIEK